MIRITSERHNFRRCGMAHPKGPVDYPDGRFSGDELDILEAEPRLKVERIKGRRDGNRDGVRDDVMDAAIAAVAAGDVTGEGKPHVKAIEKILGRDITAKERDEAWERIKGAEAGKR